MLRFDQKVALIVPGLAFAKVRTRLRRQLNQLSRRDQQWTSPGHPPPERGPDAGPAWWNPPQQNSVVGDASERRESSEWFVVTGARVALRTAGRNLRRLFIDPDDSVIVGHGAQNVVKQRKDSMRVLLADADNEFLEIVQSFLRYRGHEAEIAADGLQCISILHAFDPDLLVLDRDLLWGGREGVLQQMRQDPRFATVPVILTGDGQTADEVFARSACPVACLAKPYRLGDLLTHINKAGGPVRSALFCN